MKGPLVPDLVALALSALRQQRVRTLLSLVGVIIGTLTLALSLSIGGGVEAAFLRKLRENNELRLVGVTPSYRADSTSVPAESLRFAGTMTNERRARLRMAMIARWNREHVATPLLLTADRIAQLAAIPHVAQAIPSFRESGRAFLGDTSRSVIMASVDTADRGLRGRVIAGRLFSSASERAVIVHEYLVHGWGVRNEADVAGVIGRTVRLEYSSARRSRYPVLSMLTSGKIKPEAPEHLVLERLVPRMWPALARSGLASDERAVAKLVLQGLTPPDDPWQDPPVTETLTIVGVIRDATKNEPPVNTVATTWVSRNADVLLPYLTAQEYFFRTPWNADQGAEGVTLRVDAEENVGGVAAAARDAGFDEFSLVKVIEHFRENVLMITIALAFIAAVALLVSALGITNTMLMGVLERTREIGVMKAVGARDAHIQFVFLVEGAAIGLAGGVIGVFLSWLAQFPGDAVARSIIARQVSTPPSASVFVYPLAVVVGVPVLACAITTLAAVIPSRRAVRIDPIAALRHE